MAEPRFANDDDLPLTFRRAREERERELREREVEASGPTLGTAPVAANDEDDVPLPPRAFRPVAVAEAPTGVVRRIEIPFLHLVAFFLKAVVAAIPALILLAGLLWLGGKGLQTFLPDLGRMQIFIKFGT